MRIVSPYKQLNRFIEQESLEPLFGWGLRMGIAAMVPVLWGLYTGRVEDATWIALTAECICWVELKGSMSQRVRVLLAGVLLALIFGVLGSVTGNNIWLSLVAMLGVGFLSGLFKNLGDRGSGLATSIYVLFILTNAYPTSSLVDLEHRILLILTGGMWNAFTGITVNLFMPVQEPYRRTIAIVWKAISELIAAVYKGWDGSGIKSGVREIYLKERDVRNAMDTSFHFYEKMAHQANTDTEEYHLAQLRKATAIVAANIIAISEELETEETKSIDKDFRLKLYSLLKAMRQTADRMAVLIITLKAEERLLAESRIKRLIKLTGLLRDYQQQHNIRNVSMQRVIQLAERNVKLLESALQRLDDLGEDKSVFRSYSMMKTLFVLHPRHLLANLRLLFNFNSFTVRYAIRAAVAVTVGLFISKWFEIERGFWIPFTAMIVMQPYFGATSKKALQRIVGTVLGGLAGGLLVALPIGLYLEEAILFLSFVLMVYYIRKQYAVSVFFITLSLVILFNIEKEFNTTLIITRALSTIAGAVIAIIAGFALLPHWDKKWLPGHMANAIECNFRYFADTFFAGKPLVNWTRHKRNAETKNSNAFDSFNRYLQEPGSHKNYAVYFQVITHVVRITRELNNIHLEQDSNSDVDQRLNLDDQQNRLDTCLSLFRENIALAATVLNSPALAAVKDIPVSGSSFHLTDQQARYVDKMIIELKAMGEDLKSLKGHTKEFTDL